MICLQIGWIVEALMLRLSGGQVESLFDEVLPVEVRQLPADLEVLDRLLADPGLLAPVERAWEDRARRFGRPSVPIDRFVRLMVVKHRSGWGYETLVREVSDSLHLRRFCLLALSERVPDESTIRKLARRLGAEVVEEICRHIISVAAGGSREQRFTVRAVRIDSTVVEADVRFPTDIALADDAARTLAREANKARALAGQKAPKVRDRSRGIRARVRKLNRTLAARSGQGKATAIKLTGEAGEQVEQTTARPAASSSGYVSGLAAAARKPSSQPRGGSRSSSSAPRRCPGRSASVSRARRSPTGSCPSPTPTRARSARASCASRPSSAMSCRSPSCARTRAAAPAA